jgi:hypothetical protein
LSINERTKNAETYTDFAFNVAMENRIAPLYVTEKIGHAFNSGSVPIYWGDKQTISTIFNPESFICVNDFPNPEAAADHAIQVWRDPQKLQKYIDAPIVVNNTLADYEAVRANSYRPWMKPFVDKLRETFPDLS